MTKTRPASEDTLGVLHASLAKFYQGELDRILKKLEKTGEDAGEVTKEDISILKEARAFLKDNNIEADPSDNSAAQDGLASIREQLGSLDREAISDALQ